MSEKERKFGSEYPVPHTICNDCGEQYGRHSDTICPKDHVPHQPHTELTSLTQIKAKLDELDRKVYNVQQTVDVTRQSTLGLLTEEVRERMTRLQKDFDQWPYWRNAMEKRLDGLEGKLEYATRLIAQFALAAKPKRKPAGKRRAHKPRLGRHRS
jgi:tetrahydromethanopterin S-methyltransferase subunit G